VTAAQVLKQGCVLVHEPGLDEKEVFVLVYTPFRLLCFEAEDREINFGLREEPATGTRKRTCSELVSALFALRDPVTPEPSENFKWHRLKWLRGNDELHPVDGDEPYPRVVRYFIRPSMRYYLTYYILFRIEVPHEQLAALDVGHKGKRDANIMHLLKLGTYSQFFPLHERTLKTARPAAGDAEPIASASGDLSSRTTATLVRGVGSSNTRTQLRQEWAGRMFSRQPLDRIRDYFGERISIYYAFLGFYTVWLTWAAVLGLAVTCYGIANAVTGTFSVNASGATRIFDNVLTIPFAAFMSIWGTGPAPVLGHCPWPTRPCSSSPSFFLSLFSLLLWSRRD
jgi:hypothetical protein